MSRCQHRDQLSYADGESPDAGAQVKRRWNDRREPMFPRCGEKHRFDADGRPDVCSNYGFAFRRETAKRRLEGAGTFVRASVRHRGRPGQSAIRSAPRWTDPCQALEHKPGDQGPATSPRPARGGAALARSPTRAAKRPVPLSLVLPLPPPLDQRRDASPGEPGHQHDDRGRRDEQVCEGHSGLDDTAAQTPVVDLNRSIRALSWFAPNVLLRWRSADTASTGHGFWPASTSTVVRPVRRRRLRVGC